MRASLLASCVAFVAACSDGTQSYTEFLGATLKYGVDTAQFGGGIGPRAATCETAIDPTEETFQIWGTIYTQQAALLFPEALEPSERYHLSKVYEETGDWLRSFTDEQSNTRSVAALENMECHLKAAAASSCESTPRAFACCALTEYYTWLRVATSLSQIITSVYGETCGTAVNASAALPLFAQKFGRIVSDLPSAGPDDAATRAARAVLAWAWKGVCDARNGDCPLVDAPALAVAPIQAMSEQTPLALTAALSCV